MSALGPLIYMFYFMGFSFIWGKQWRRLGSWFC